MMMLLTNSLLVFFLMLRLIRRTCAVRDPRLACGFEDDFLDEGSECCARGAGDDLDGPLFSGSNGVPFLDMSSRTYMPECGSGSLSGGGVSRAADAHTIIEGPFDM